MPDLGNWFRENVVGRHAHLFLDGEGRLHLHRSLTFSQDNIPKESPLLSLRIGGFWRSSRLEGEARNHWDVCDDWDWSFGFVDKQGLILPVTDIPMALRIIQKFNSVEEFLNAVAEKLNSPVAQAMEIVQIKQLQDKLAHCEKNLKQSEVARESQKQELDFLRNKLSIAENLREVQSEDTKKRQAEFELAIAGLELKAQNLQEEVSAQQLEQLDIADSRDALAARVAVLEAELELANKQVNKKKSQLETVYRKLHACIEYVKESMTRSKFQPEILERLK